MKATVCCGLLMVTCCDPFTAMNITIWVGISVELVPNWQALPRTFVMRITRVLVVPGASIGTPSQVTEFTPNCRPEYTVGVPGIVSYGVPAPSPTIGQALPCGVHSTCGGGEPCGTNTVLSGTRAASGGSGSSIISVASDRLPAPMRRLVTLVFKKICTLDSGTAPPRTEGFPPVQFRNKSPTSSVMPSARMMGGTLAFALHQNAGLTACAFAGAVPRLSRMAATASPKNHLRRYAISFSF